MKHLSAGFVLFLLLCGGVFATAQEVYDGGGYTI
jgi:hypothetical protein